MVKRIFLLSPSSFRKNIFFLTIKYSFSCWGFIFPLFLPFLVLIEHFYYSTSIINLLLIYDDDLVTQSYLTLCEPVDFSQPARLLCPWDFPGKNTGVSCHFLFQGTFLPFAIREGACGLRKWCKLLVLKFDWSSA